ncbi:zinc transport system substrate-binding protein [Streptomyces sp. DvalAA-14]|uniref:metal ABC transporter substrate-binding protein n=1 Tax=unclassified Streptomyces TaxID=2593676 RepID=UPI00081B5AD8|nr:MULTISPECIES: metal ABC transporter substrate-binding protein [unclassified Streptomyces]MYS23019.1 zinc ABC transporter solute-binding protein [Streptomyces sp. SID4948]SCE26134.1 zinc transport system substrate-binding protein [Streptomyces sp. DvalAA-14]
MNEWRRVIPATALAAAVALVLPALAACSGDASAAAGSGADRGKVKVTASFYPLEFLVRQIGGARVSVTELTRPGVEPHDLELSPRQVGRLGDADLAVYLRGLQPAVDAAIEQSGVRRSLDAGSLTTLEDHGTEVDGRYGTTGDHGSGGHRDDPGADPHIWLDPVRYAQVARGVGRALAQADPAYAAGYRAATDTLVGRLEALDARFRDGLRHRSSDTFVTTHAAFGYLAERYGLVEEAINGIDPDSEPSAARMRALQDLAGREHVSTVFFETLTGDRTATTVAGDLGLRTDVLDPIEGITAASRGADYFQVQQANLRALRTALGAV